MTLFQLLGPAALAALLSFCLTPGARWASVRFGAIDQPDPRKVHLEPMPRLGGLAVLLAVAALFVAGYFGLLGPYLKLPGSLARGIALGAVPVVAISLYDDLHSVRACWKALAHLAGALIAVQLGVVLKPEIHFLGEPLWIGILAVPFSLLWIVGLTNAFNLVDGLDGLSAGLALISSVSLAAVFLIVGERTTAACVLVLAGALVGFLPFNLYPAKVFLGDTGASSIGFVLACFALKGGATLSAGFATVLPILVLGLPIAETLISMVRRVVRRTADREAGIFNADRDHIHHRLLYLGVSHRQAVLILYGVGLFFAAIGFVSLFLTSQHAGLLLAALLLAAFIGVKRLGYDEFALLRKGLVLRVYNAPVVRSALFAVFFDLALVAVSYYIARGLKHDLWAPRMPSPESLTLVGLLALASVGAFWLFGLYRGTWRLASLDDVMRCGAAVGASTLLVWGLAPRMTAGRADASQFAIYALVAAGLVCGSRISYRLLQDQAWKASTAGQPVLIYGAGHAGIAAMRELQRNADWGLRPVGFLDDDPLLRGKTVSSLPVLGGFDLLESLVEKVGAQAIAIATAKIPSERVEEVRRTTERLSIALYRFEIGFQPESGEHPQEAVVSPRFP